jgi:hypothetical protein
MTLSSLLIKCLDQIKFYEFSGLFRPFLIVRPFILIFEIFYTFQTFFGQF